MNDWVGATKPARPPQLAANKIPKWAKAHQPTQKPAKSPHAICYPKNRAECIHPSHGTYPWLFHCKSFSKTNLAASLLEIMVCGTEGLNAPETGQISVVNFNR